MQQYSLNIRYKESDGARGNSRGDPEGGTGAGPGSVTGRAEAANRSEPLPGAGRIQNAARGGTGGGAGTEQEGRADLDGRAGQGLEEGGEKAGKKAVAIRVCAGRTVQCGGVCGEVRELVGGRKKISP